MKRLVAHALLLVLNQEKQNLFFLTVLFHLGSNPPQDQSKGKNAYHETLPQYFKNNGLMAALLDQKKLNL